MGSGCPGGGNKVGKHQAQSTTIVSSGTTGAWSLSPSSCGPSPFSARGARVSRLFRGAAPAAEAATCNPCDFLWALTATDLWTKPGRPQAACWDRGCPPRGPQGWGSRDQPLPCGHLTNASFHSNGGWERAALPFTVSFTHQVKLWVRFPRFPLRK